MIDLTRFRAQVEQLKADAIQRRDAVGNSPGELAYWRGADGAYHHVLALLTAPDGERPGLIDGHRPNCPAIQAWDIPGACTCDRGYADEERPSVPVSTKGPQA